MSYFNKSVQFSGTQSLVSGDKNVFFLLVQEEHLSHDSLSPAFRKKKGG